MRGSAKAVVMVLSVCVAAGSAFAQDPQKAPNISTELRERIDKLIVQLGDRDFEKRDAAQAELIKIGEPALGQIQKALKESSDPEVLYRATMIAERIDKSALVLLGKNGQGLEEFRHKKSGMIFVKVPGGKFKMGSDTGGAAEKPAHEVKVDGFLIAKYEVTQAVWQKVMRSETESASGGGSDPSKYKGDDNPVEVVSWDDCQEFCKKTGLRLPTEAEWEYACRGGAATNYYWGDEPDGDCAWFAVNSGGTTHAVGGKKPNGFGLHDMSGNVMEWCQDWFGEDYFKNGIHDNPKGPEKGVFRMLKGGSYGCGESNCRPAYRFMVKPENRDVYIGFRCVLPQ